MLLIIGLVARTIFVEEAARGKAAKLAGQASDLQCVDAILRRQGRQGAHGDGAKFEKWKLSPGGLPMGFQGSFPHCLREGLG